MNRIMREAYNYIFSDGMILHYPFVKSKDNVVNLHYFKEGFEHGEKNEQGYNLGDELSKTVTEFMLEKRNLSLDAYVEGRKHLYAIGSILLMGYQNAAVWGTGLPFEPSALRSLLHRKPFRKLDVRLTRGPLTRKVIMSKFGGGADIPDIYADPAVLMPYIYTPKKAEEKKEYVIIPHFSQEKLLAESYPEDMIIGMATDDYASVIDGICSAKKVISSSLHGIILAEAYGVPAVFYRDRPERFNFKYEDWYASTGREFVSRTLDEALKCEAEPLDKEITKQLSDNALSTFPYDLWNI